MAKKQGQARPFALKRVKPLTPAQHDVFEAFEEGYNLCLTGFPGTGKTFLALYLGLRLGRVKIIRSVVSSRDVGFLPGSAKDKAAVYETPYNTICSELYDRGDAYQILKQRDMVSFETTSFLRGTTIDGCTVIIDEAQNLSYHELKTVITRIGKDSRIIIVGDTGQNDLVHSKYDVSGFPKFLDVLDRMQSFDFVDFDAEDIVRSGLVKEFILAENMRGF